jgi:drug/metabolite transporter (DMT)-like permease
VRNFTLFVLATIISHVAFAWLPFEAREFSVGGGLGPYWAAATFYLISLILSFSVLAVFPSGRRQIRDVRQIGGVGVGAGLWFLFIVLSVGMVFAYYVGLQKSGPAPFQLWTRLDMFIAFILGPILLRERVGMVAAIATFLGFLSWFGIFFSSPTQYDHEAIAWAAGYVVLNGFLCVVTKGICDQISEGTLYLVRTTIVMIALVLGGVLLQGTAPSFGTLELRHWIAGVASAIFLAGVIYGRFAALRRGPLWLYAAVGVVQVGAVKGFDWLYGKNELSWLQVLLGIFMFVSAAVALWSMNRIHLKERQ